MKGYKKLGALRIMIDILYSFISFRLKQKTV